MFGSETSDIAFVEQSTVSARRRVQNRVAQQKYRERQKNKNSAVASSSGGKAVPDTTENGRGQNSQYHWDHALIANPGITVPSPSAFAASPYSMEFEGIKQSLIAPPQCYTPSMLPPPSPQIRHIYRAGPDNSVASLTLDDLSDFTEDQHQFQYTQQSGVFESHFKSDQGESQFGSSTNTSSSSPSPSAYGSNLTSYRSNDSLPVSNPSTAEPLSTTQTMSANLKAPLLHVAIRTRKKSVVRLLLRRGASTVDERDALGRTALHIAAQCGDEEMVRTILQHGADPKILDREGLDALRLAVEHARCEVIEILLDAIAQREELNGMPALV